MNLRPFPLFIETVSTREAAERWLDEQSRDVRRVTYLDADGRLMQKPVIEPGSYVDPHALLIGGLIIRPVRGNPSGREQRTPAADHRR